MSKHFNDRKPRTTGFLLFALREISLLVVGILVALYVNNWNEARKQQVQFEALLQQFYNAIFRDNELLLNTSRLTSNQITIIDSLILGAVGTPINSLPWLYHDLSQNHLLFNPESLELRPFLNYKSGNQQQNLIIKQLLSYGKTGSLTSKSDIHNELRTILIKKGIPAPELFPIGLAASYISREPPPFYSKNQAMHSHQLLSNEAFRSLLISLKSEKVSKLRTVTTEIENGRSIIQSIRNFYPEVKLGYEDMGIIGDALESGWQRSTPMTCTDPGQGIWEVDISLKTGRIKFRDRNTWKDNWGSFFNGRATLTGPLTREGSDILVEAGFYHVQINIMEGSYELKKLDYASAND